MSSKYWFGFLVLFFIVILSSFAFASYRADLFFTVPTSIYSPAEKIELKGYLFLTNTSDDGTVVSNNSPVSGATVTMTLINKSSGNITSTVNLTTDSSGSFYSNSSYYVSSPTILAPGAGSYTLKAAYTDPNATVWYSSIDISVLNQSVDELRISTDQSVYTVGDTVQVTVKAVRIIGDNILNVANVTVNASIRYSNKTIIQAFTCTTDAKGACGINSTSISSNGNYLVEVNSFKAFNMFSVNSFDFTVYMKDDLGQSLKNTYARSEQASVEVSILTNSTSDVYSFSGTVVDSDGTVVKEINTTQLNTTNAYTNRFVFTVDSAFSFGVYTARVSVTKSSGSTLNGTTSFKVRDWDLAFKKRDTNSGFEYAYNVFYNRTMWFEIYPTSRTNGSNVISGINTTLFNVSLTDKLNNVISNTTVSWNASCSTSGCYQFSLSSPVVLDRYTLSVTVAYNGDSQSVQRVVSVIDSVVSAQTDNSQEIKELFGTNEFVYIKLSTYNLSNQINLTNAQIVSVTYMNGTEISYTQVDNFSQVNISNSVNEWAWNVTSQRLKLDPPKDGGLYNVIISANDGALGSFAKFIINPYDICTVAKDTPGDVSSQSGFYYVWQFKTTDTVYFELTMTQADNPLGKAAAENITSSNSSTYGRGSACTYNTQQAQVVNNATVVIEEVRNVQNDRIIQLNSTGSVCVANTNGKYTCTLQPRTKWDGGEYNIRFKSTGLDGSSDIVYGRFEARSFYLYGYSTNYMIKPTSSVSLFVKMYEAGANWWSTSGSSGGLTGTVSVEKVEYQGRPGEWIWPPVSYNYTNLSNATTTITTGSGVINLSAAYSGADGRWKTGNYRVILKGVDSSGNVDYGYAWFTVRMWDVYGMPIECVGSECNYKNYFNSQENISLYVRIVSAGDYNDNGGVSLGGNVTISVKNIQDCRTWPCKEINSSTYTSNSLNVNKSSPWYWGSEGSVSRKAYLINISTTTGTWGTGSYQVTFDVNGSETGSAWFNTIAFYVDSRPTDVNGTNYVYSIKPSQSMYFNVTTTKNYKGWNVVYNTTDYVNATVESATLRAWDPVTYRSVEYKYPAQINVTLVNKSGLLVPGNALLNLSYRNGSWPTNYYNGEIILRNSANETSTGWVYFQAQPFRVNSNANTYEVDLDACANVSVQIYEPYWYASTPIVGNFSIIGVTENIWSGSGNSLVTYTNYTNTSFNGTKNIIICPNSADWGSGSWGGYHYLNLLVRDNSDNSTQTGWAYFRAVPFKISWATVGGSSNKVPTDNIMVNVSLTKPSNGAVATGNLSRLYQWRYDSYGNTLETYNFSIGSCDTRTGSASCNITGNATVTVYAPAAGWKVGYNYIQGDWKSSSGSLIQDWNQFYFNAVEVYNGYFQNSDANGNYKYYFALTDNITIKLYAQNMSYGATNVSLTKVEYAYSGSNCWDEYCRTYVTSSYSIVGNTGGASNTSIAGNGIITIAAPSGGWTRGAYTIRATISGSLGSAIVRNGQVYAKNLTNPAVTITAPSNNINVTNSTFTLIANTSVNTVCYMYAYNYNNNWVCSGWNASNGSNSSTVTYEPMCNSSRYGFNGSTYYYEYVARDYHGRDNGSQSSWGSEVTGLSTGGQSHTYTFNVASWRPQHYMISVHCNDEDYNYAYAFVAIKVNVTNTTVAALAAQYGNFSDSNGSYVPRNYVRINVTANGSNVSNVTINLYNSSLSSIYSATTSGNQSNATVTNLSDGTYYFNATARNTTNSSSTVTYSVVVDTTYPQIGYNSSTFVNGTLVNQTYLNVSVNINETNVRNVTFRLYNLSSTVNITTIAFSHPSGIYSVNWTNLPNTTYTFNVIVEDLAGNTNTTVTRTIILNGSDNVAPSIAFVNGTDTSGSYFTYNYTTINVTASDANLANITIYIYNSTTLVNSTTTSSTTNTVTYTGLPDGIYFFNASSFDVYGNKNITSTRNITVDTIKPQIAFANGTPSNGSSASGTSIYINLTVTEININYLTYRIYNTTALVNATNSTATFLNFTNLVAGNYSFNVTILDLAGNSNLTTTRYANLT